MLIDDEPHIHFTVCQVFADQPVRLISAATAEDGLRQFEEERPEVVLLDVRLKNKSGLDLFNELRRIDPKLLVIFITGHGTADTAIEAMKLGAFEYLVKPLDFSRLRDVVSQALQINLLMRVPTVVEDASTVEPPEQIIGRGPAMQLVFKQIGRVAPQDVNVLVLGESGTGKELVAKAVYQHSTRSGKTFLAINCGAIAENLLESELFGHERGAFTGADRRRIGKFEQCNGGTLFLDEAGDMPLATQVKLLRVLQEGAFERVGGNETVHVDVRIIAATNQNLEAMIEQGRFRRDLYYRLKGVAIFLPPLRERNEDVAELAHYFLFRLNRKLGTNVQTISPDSLELLRSYSWPGNIRELQSALRVALISSAGSVLLPHFLSSEFHSNSGDDAVQINVPTVQQDDWTRLGKFVEDALSNGEANLYHRAIDEFDRKLIVRAFSKTEGHQARAALLLGISRPTLRSKIRALGMAVEKFVTPDVTSHDGGPNSTQERN
ncbi:MAG: sigma-54 dependent transcriptional regulator [Planctomycetaceae bacterium]